MAVSLEARVPLLNRRVVEFAWRVPTHLKYRPDQGKWLLRQALYRHIPHRGRRGGQPTGLAVMLRIYLMQQWFGLPACSRQVRPMDGRQPV